MLRYTRLLSAPQITAFRKGINETSFIGKTLLQMLLCLYVLEAPNDPKAYNIT